MTTTLIFIVLIVIVVLLIQLQNDFNSQIKELQHKMDQLLQRRQDPVDDIIYRPTATTDVQLAPVITTPTIFKSKIWIWAGIAGINILIGFLVFKLIKDMQKQKR